MPDHDDLLPHEPLVEYLSSELDETVTGVEVLNVGVNVVASVATDDGPAPFVLRRPHKLRESALFNDLRAEYAVLEALDTTAVPAPEPIAFCDDESIVGAPFFLTSFVDGEGVPWDGRLPPRFRTPAARRDVADALVDELAAVHSVDPAPFEDVCGRRSPREQVERTVERLDHATSVTGHSFPRLRSVGDWLQRNAPANSRRRLVHGDYKPDNVFLAPSPDPRVTGVLDWETAALGDPLTELGYFLLYWRDDGDPQPAVDDLVAAGREAPDAGAREDRENRTTDANAATDAEHLRRRMERGFWPFTNEPGSPSRAELVGRYEAETGLAFENARFHRALAAFGLAAVWADLDRHAVETGGEPGNGLHVRYVAWLAERIVADEFPL